MTETCLVFMSRVCLIFCVPDFAPFSVRRERLVLHAVVFFVRLAHLVLRAPSPHFREQKTPRFAYTKTASFFVRLGSPRSACAKSAYYACHIFSCTELISFSMSEARLVLHARSPPHFMCARLRPVLHVQSLARFAYVELDFFRIFLHPPCRTLEKYFV